jgi:hypothetical protein
MNDVTHTQSNDGMLKNAATIGEDNAEYRVGDSSVNAVGRVEEGDARAGNARRRPWARSKKRKSYSHENFKVYKRRWFGLAQLVLLNTVVSWDVSIVFPNGWCCSYLYSLSVWSTCPAVNHPLTTKWKERGLIKKLMGVSQLWRQQVSFNHDFCWKRVKRVDSQ